MESRYIANLLTVLILLSSQSSVVRGHGRLIDPPSRSSMWRYGFDNPKNYDDHALYCGGFYAQWYINGGRCGVCGDRYDRPRENEAGGKYANGIIVRHYREGQIITVNVELTQSHLGFFEFRICPNNNSTRPVTQQCLDRYLLRQPDGSTRFKVVSWDDGVRSISLVLPPGLTCSQCVLQWKYNIGNSWGCERAGQSQRCCIGCGPQEQFYGCADVDVTSFPGGSDNNPTVTSTLNSNDVSTEPQPGRNPHPLGHGVQVVSPTRYQPPTQFAVIPTSSSNQQPLYSNPFYRYQQPNGRYIPRL